MHPSYLQYWRVLFLLLFLTRIVNLCHISDALRIVISFLVLRSICLSSSFAHSKNGPKYLTRETSQVFIPLVRFLLQNLVSRSFLVRLRYSYNLKKIFIFTCLMVSAFNIPKYLLVSFFPSILIISWFDSSYYFTICKFFTPA